MSLKDTILTIVQRELKESPFFLVGSTANQDGTSIRIFIDGIDGVGIKFCARLSRTISAELDEMELDTERFRFEISSPGADNPLVDIRQYHKHIGRELNIALKDGNETDGVLLKVEENELEVEKLIDQKKNIKQIINIDYENIESSKVKISFKRIKK
ncbi:MAG: ribosome maturation factor RimP [Bacteroidia bacterium]